MRHKNAISEIINGRNTEISSPLILSHYKLKLNAAFEKLFYQKLPDFNLQNKGRECKGRECNPQKIHSMSKIRLGKSNLGNRKL